MCELLSTLLHLSLPRYCGSFILAQLFSHRRTIFLRNIRHVHEREPIRALPRVRRFFPLASGG